MPKADEVLTPTDAEVYRYQKAAWDHPVAWMKGALKADLWSRQQDIVRALRDHSQVAVRSANAVGKSYVSACITIWFLETHCPGYVVITGSSWTNIEKIIWPWIHTFVERSPILFGGDMPATEWRRGPLWGAFSVSPGPEAAERMAGFRTAHGVLVIVDEASSLDKSIHDAIMGLTMSFGSRVLYIGNPLRPYGPFRDVFDNPKWHHIAISAFDTPNLTAGKTVIPGLADPDKVADLKVEFGEDSPQYQARVLGEFPDVAMSRFFSPTLLKELMKDVQPPTLRGDIRFEIDPETKKLKPETVRFVERENGPFKLWIPLQNGRPPQDRNYGIGGDISEGVGVSNSVLSVAENRNNELVAQYVDANKLPHEFAAVGAALGVFFAGQTKQAYMVWEANGMGLVFGKEVMRLGHRRVYWRRDETKSYPTQANDAGWHSTQKGKEFMLEEFRHKLATHDLIQHCKESVDEAELYMYRDDGKIGPLTKDDDVGFARRPHGDRVIADGLASMAIEHQPRATKRNVSTNIRTFAGRQKLRRERALAEKAGRWA